LTRSGIAHLYFVSIHPFEDGNGRIGRAIAEKALAQSWATDFDCIGGHDSSATAGVLRCARGRQQEKRNHGLAVVVAGIVIAGQRSTIANVEFLIAKNAIARAGCEAS